MKTFIYALLVTTALTTFACGSDCLTRSDCELGQYCEFTSGECREGCQSNSDCGPTAVCETQTGVCRSTRPPAVRDAGMLDASTSSVADAGG